MNEQIILIVEDNPDHAELFRRVLESQGLAADTVFQVSDGMEALDYLHRRGRFSELDYSPNPGLILLDLRLPRMNGLDVLRDIKESEGVKRIPVVILTSSDSEKDKALAYDLHANSYILKPFDFDELFELLGNLTQYWLKWNSYCEGESSS